MEKFNFNAPVVQTMDEYLPAPYIDKASSTVTYYGWAKLGVGEKDSGWRIMRETVSGSVTKREYADGSMNFEFKWQDRTSYSYSR